MKYILLNDSKSRIEAFVTVQRYRIRIWIDTGSPNTLISENLMKRLKLKSNEDFSFNGNIAGSSFKQKPSVTIPLIDVQGKLSLRNVRAIVGLPNNDMWNDIIIIGMNVLNHCSFKIDRTQIPNIFECYESLTSKVGGSNRNRFDHILIDNKYLLT